MKLLKPGDPCPCCGRPIKEGLSTENILLLSYIAEGIALAKAGQGVKEQEGEEEHDGETKRI